MFSKSPRISLTANNSNSNLNFSKMALCAPQIHSSMWFFTEGVRMQPSYNTGVLIAYNILYLAAVLTGTRLASFVSVSSRGYWKCLHFGRSKEACDGSITLTPVLWWEWEWQPSAGEWGWDAALGRRKQHLCISPRFALIQEEAQLCHDSCRSALILLKAWCTACFHLNCMCLEHGTMLTDFMLIVNHIKLLMNIFQIVLALYMRQ